MADSYNRWRGPNMALWATILTLSPSAFICPPWPLVSPSAFVPAAGTLAHCSEALNGTDALLFQSAWPSLLSPLLALGIFSLRSTPCNCSDSSQPLHPVLIFSFFIFHNTYYFLLRNLIYFLLRLLLIYFAC